MVVDLKVKGVVRLQVHITEEDAERGGLSVLASNPDCWFNFLADGSVAVVDPIFLENLHNFDKIEGMVCSNRSNHR